MLVIICALAAEARCCIDYFELQRDREVHPFSFYRGEEMALAVCGLGKLRAAAVTACVLSKYVPEARFVLSFGCCGAAAQFPLEQAYLAQRVTDFASRSDFYPDLLISSNFKEAALVTVDRPLSGGQALCEHPHALYDMEASGVFQSARLFLPSSAVQALKVVSDHLDPRKEDFSDERLDRLFQPLMPALGKYIQTALTLHAGMPENVTLAADNTLFEQLSACIGLSFSQRQLLLRRLALLPLSNAQLVLEKVLAEATTGQARSSSLTKQQRKRLLDTTFQYISAECRLSAEP